MSAPTTTISSLPYELLVAIAVAGQEDRVAESNWEIRTTTFKSEWTLSQLSHRFRDVIVGAPALWTLIETDFISEGSVEILNLYLERSRASKLSIMLCQQWSSRAVGERLLLTGTNHIVPHVHRIQRLRILLEKRWAWDMLALFRDEAAPHLQHLEIVCATLDETPLVMFSSGVPRLDFLKIDGFILQSPAAAFALTHLELRKDWCIDPAYPTLNQYAALTAQCPLLEYLQLDVNWVPEEAPRFLIPTLKYLRISIPGEDADYLLAVVGIFDAPALTELIFDGTHGDQIAFLLGRKTLPHSIFPALTSLTFLLRDSCGCESANENLPSHTISSPPAIFPALSRLTLINQCFTEHLIQDMLGPASHPWPLLKTITLGAVDDSFEKVGAAVEDPMDSKRQRGEPVPEVQLLQLLSRENWSENGPYAERSCSLGKLSSPVSHRT
ncbi:hypothetical protein DFH08DRAFT_802839 [Mycena albidolilacea]|uniref:F-box domain-containing protein n=1 Tax=Mycena albidolilacea TaxID=1033008 RepID=A0AAD7AEZ3_9AGAR|nr:hypothetical protein DFH08DRAFT_802839 [Mycena albidolilacea]